MIKLRHQVIKTALEKWDKMCGEEDVGVRPVHRPREWKEKERRLAKEQKKNTWHQTRAGQMSAPLIIDPSSGPLTGEMRSLRRSPR